MDHSDVLTTIYRASKTDDLSSFQKYLLENALDSAARSAAKFDFINASTILLNALVSLQSPKPTTEVVRLQARCLTELGNIRRDQGIVSGVGGALEFYSRSLEFWKYLEEKPRVAYLDLCIGICHEMQMNYQKALRHFKRGIATVEQTKGLYPLLGSLYLRLAALMTKIGAVRETEEALKRSLSLLEDRVPPVNFASARLKAAALYLSKGELDKAHRVVEQSLEVIGSDDKMRQTRAHVLLADILLRANEQDAALQAAFEAEQIANQHGFSHQRSSLYRIFDKGTSISVPHGQSTIIAFDAWQDPSALRVYQALSRSVSAEDIQNICTEIGIAYESLYGDHIDEKLRSLIIRAQLADRLEVLNSYAGGYAGEEE